MSSESQAVLARMANLSVNEEYAIEQFVDTLVAANQWDNVYDLYCFLLNSTDYLTGWRLHTLTPSGAVHGAEGVVFASGSDYLQAPFAPLAVETWNSSGACAGGYVASASGSGNWDVFGAVGTGSDFYLRNRDAGDVQAILGSTLTTPRLPSIPRPFTGYFFARSDATTRYIRVNDDTISGAQSLVPTWSNQNYVINGRNNGGTQENGGISTHSWHFIGNENLDDQVMLDAITQFSIDLANGPPPQPGTGVKILPIREPLRAESVYTFNGSNQYLEANVDLYDGQNTHPGTVCTWFRPNVNDASGSLISFADPTGASPDNIRIDLLARNTGYLAVARRLTTREHVVPYEINKWQFAAGAFDTNFVHIWLNNSGTINTGSFTAFLPMTIMSIGRRGDSTPSNYFNGASDHVAAYDKVLSEQQLTALWNGGRGLDPRLLEPQSLLGYWVNGRDLWRGNHLAAFNNPAKVPGYPVDTKPSISYFPMPAAPPPPTRRMKIITFRQPVGVV